MSYKLIDLGKPKTFRVYATAYIVTPEGSYMIKGEMDAINRYIAKIDLFYGKLRSFNPRTLRRFTTIISHGFRLQFKTGRKRCYYEFRDSKFDILWLKVRRLPKKWPRELETDMKSHVLVSADYLEEKGFYFSAKLLRAIAEAYQCNAISH